MFVVGIDLSGPSNTKETSVVSFREQADETLILNGIICDATDEKIYRLVQELAFDTDVVVGIDAPLSYNPGGGDRPGDKSLRQQLTGLGMKSGSVMTPTMTRMVYLTLRGIAVARLLKSIDTQHAIKIVEVHPGATLALRGANLNQIMDLKKDNNAQIKLLDWLTGVGLQGITLADKIQDHYVAACASALAAWKWHSGKSVWLERAAKPFHPYDFAC